MTAFFVKVSPAPHTITELPPPEQQETLLKFAQDADIQNAAAWEALRERWRALKAETAELLEYNRARTGPRDPLRAWFEKGPLDEPLSHHRTQWSTIMRDRFRRLQEETEVKARKAKEAQKQQELSAMPARAVIFLIKHGKVAGVDFQAETAIEAANELTRALLLTRAMPKPGEFVSFNGDDDCEGCDGWDGESRRCECGNRRVYWETSGDFEDFEAGRAYASAQAD